MPIPFNRFSLNFIWYRCKALQIILWPWVCVTLRSRSPHCEGHTRFWLLCQNQWSDFHQTWNSICVEHKHVFCDPEFKVISKVKGQFIYWLLCLYLWTDFHQNWYSVCLKHGCFIHDLDVKVIRRSKVETGNTFEWLAILFSFEAHSPLGTPFYYSSTTISISPPVYGWFLQKYFLTHSSFKLL